MKINFRTILILIALAIIPTIIVWAPFAFQLESFWGLPVPSGGMQTVISNFDGPLYIIVAKSLYNLEFIAQNYALDLPLEYYAAHFPLFPILIRFTGVLFGHPWGMMISTLIGSLISIYYFFKLARVNLNTNQALWLTSVFALFPARWLIVRSVGSPEPLFIGSILASIYYFNKKNYWATGFWGVAAQLTKSPGILLFVALTITILVKDLDKLASSKQSLRKWFFKLNFRAFPIALIPLSLLCLFYFYGQPASFNDYLAYFNSGDNIHLFFPPFQIFNYTQPWVNTFWLEEILFIYGLILLGIFKLFKEKKHTMGIFVLTFFTTIIFVSHRDILRYSLPTVPFLILAFEKELQSKQAKIILAFLLVPTILFAIAFISGNVMPISDWAPYL